MNCNCKKEIEEKLTARFVESTPAATQQKVTLKGYGLCLGENTLHERALMEYETYALMPLKSGGSKPKKTKGSMVFSFCPFCGVDARVKPAGEAQ